MGNAFQEAAAHVAFVFSVEDNEVPPPPLEREKHDAYIVGYPNGNASPERQHHACRGRHDLLPSAAGRCARTGLVHHVSVPGCGGQQLVQQSGRHADERRHPRRLPGRQIPTRTSTSPARSLPRSRRCSSTRRRSRATRSPISPTAGRASTSTARRLFGLVSGLPDGTFRPNAEITRAEVMEIINNVLFRTPDKDHFLDDMVKWPDNSNPERLVL